MENENLSPWQSCECFDTVMSLLSQTDSLLNKHLVATGEFHWDMWFDMTAEQIYRGTSAGYLSLVTHLIYCQKMKNTWKLYVFLKSFANMKRTCVFLAYESSKLYMRDWTGLQPPRDSHIKDSVALATLFVIRKRKKELWMHSGFKMSQKHFRMRRLWVMEGSCSV